jgi:hypothetical protein
VISPVTKIFFMLFFGDIIEYVPFDGLPYL